MTKRNTPFVTGEWYHCFNHSIEKRISFEDSRDYHRFLELLYLANSQSPLRRDDIGMHKFEEVLNLPRAKRLVAIGAFCLMPNRFDLVLNEIIDGGITAFMRKIGTAYTLYFNARYKRVGNLFLKPFQSRQVSSDSLQLLTNYVHCNPAALYEPGWRINHVVDPQFLEERMVAYPYSSLGAYRGTRAATATILDTELLSITPAVPLQKMLHDARQYYADFDIP